MNLFFAEKSRAGRFEDRLCAATISPQGRLRRTWEFSQPGHRLNLLSAATNDVRLRDFSAAETLTIDAKGKIVSHTPLGKPGGFVTLPIAVDLDGDGRNELVV